MFKLNLITCLFLLTILFSCSDGNSPLAKKISKVNLVTENKKEGFNPLKHGFTCDSLALTVENKGVLIKSFIVSLGNMQVDTINLLTKKIQTGAEQNIIITDFNFDGFCDFVLPDDLSASHGGMNYYYYLYDSSTLGYIEVKSLPKFNGGFKMDIKNQRVKIYCPYQDCFAYYKQQENGKFKLVKGEFKVEP